MRFKHTRTSKTIQTRALEKATRAQTTSKEKTKKTRAASLKSKKRKEGTAAMWAALDTLPDDLQVEEDERGIVGGMTAAWTQIRKGLLRVRGRQSNYPYQVRIKQLELEIESLKRRVAGSTPTSLPAYGGDYHSDSANLAQPLAMDFQSGPRPDYNTFSSGNTSPHQYDTPFEPPTSWPASQAQNVSHPTRATLAPSISGSSPPQPGTHLFYRDCSYVNSAGLYTPPLNLASLSPHPLSSLPRDGNQFMPSPTMSAPHPTQVLSSDFSTESIVPGHQDEDRLSTTLVTPVSWKAVLDQDFEHVMAAMADPSHPIARLVSHGPYYEAGETNILDTTTWNHPTTLPPGGVSNQREAQPRHPTSWAPPTKQCNRDY